MSAFKVEGPIEAAPCGMENTIIYRAQSILVNMVEGHPPILPYKQAQDVVDWAERGARIQ